MPLYEYRCEACGETEEKLQSLSAPEAHDCPKCGLPTGMKRQVSIVSFSLAGDGWYKSDYSKKSEPAAKETTTVSGSDKPSTGGCCGNCACHS
jgi:putative FmdB family regulatory protein